VLWFDFAMSRSSTGSRARFNKRKSMKSLINKLFLKQKWHAKRRGLSWLIDFKQWHRLVTSDCYLCAKPPMNAFKCGSLKHQHGLVFKYQGLDRVDNSIGYELDNIAPCCKICNSIKSNRSIDEFIDHISLILKNKKAGNNET